MLEVKVENILPVTEARDTFNQLIDKVEGTDEMFVMTKNGKPIAILVGVHHLEKLTGENHEELFGTTGSTPVDGNISNEAAKTDSTVDQPIAQPEVTPVVDTQNQMPAENTAIPEVPATTIAPAVSTETPATPAVADAASTAQTTSPFTYDNVTTEQAASPLDVPTDATVAPEAPVQDPTAADTQATVQTPAASDAFAVPNDPFATPDPTAAPASVTTPDTNTDNNQNNPASSAPAV
jgi:prevent-host-death family protein